MTTWMLAGGRPIVLRSSDEMVSALLLLPAEERTDAFATVAHARAVDEGREDDALFWSEVLLLLRCCDEAGVALPVNEGLGVAARERPADEERISIQRSTALELRAGKLRSSLRGLAGLLTRPVLEGIVRRHQESV